MVDAIRKELTETGFIPLGGTYWFRSIAEQVELMSSAHRLGLKTVVPVYADKNGILLPFLEGTSLEVYLRQGGVLAIGKALDNLIAAHSESVVFGDRWVKNTIVEKDDVVEVDFDIALDGRKAKEFELSQYLYHMIHFSGKRTEALQFLQVYFRSKPRYLTYDFSAVQVFLTGYTEFLLDREYEGISGGIVAEIRELVQIFPTIPPYGEAR